jgi:putative endonuclease
MPSRKAAPPPERRVLRGKTAQARGIDAEAIACGALEAEGWRVLARRLRTGAGEVDAIAEREGLLAFIEVKARPNLAGAAWALSPKQQARLLAAAEIVLAEHPDWGRAGIRFDVLLVDSAGRVRRIADAFRQGN